MKKFRNLVLALLVGYSLYLAGSRLYDFASGAVPPGKPGECLDIQIQERTVQVKIISNDKKKKTSIIAVRVFDGWMELEATFQELRELGAKRVNCEESN